MSKTYFAVLKLALSSHVTIACLSVSVSSESNKEEKVVSCMRLGVRRFVSVLDTKAEAYVMILSALEFG